MSKKNEQKYRKLDEISHVLLRPGMYIGSVKPHNYEKYLYNPETNKMELSKYSVIPGFLKLFDEVITNSVDENKRKGSKLNTVKVEIKDNKISVWDNGGIPVEIHKEVNEYIPEMIFSSLRAGSNFNDDESRQVAGTNGVGSSLVNIFSKEFTVSTCDGKNKFYQRFNDNLSKRTTPSVSESKTNHTKITFLPDYKRFGMKGMDEITERVILKRVVDLAGANPKIKFYFNGEQIKIKSFEDYIKMYVDDPITEGDSNWSIGISTSEKGQQQISFVNSVETYDGGSHVDYILDQIVVKLREYFNKKHKVDVKPSQLKNHMFVFINTTVINPAFSSQTKEKLISETRDFGSEYEVSKRFINKILKSDIVASILEWIEAREIAKKKRELAKLNKSLSKKKVDKLIDASGKDRLNCSIGIFEGDSASGAFRKFRSPQTMGAFALKGKFMNVTGINHKRLIKNKEVVNLMASIGLRLGHKPTREDLRYGKIYFYCDQDVDGFSIVGLLINFFYEYWPELFDQERIYKVETPLVVANKGKNKKFFYTQSEFEKWMDENDTKSWRIKYKKGLGSLEDPEYKEIIHNPKLTLLTKDDVCGDTLDKWFGKSSEPRKKLLLF